MNADWPDALRSAEGQAVLAALRAEPPTPATEIAIASRLRARHDPALVSEALSQFDLRRRAAAKFSRADEMLFTSDGLQQASSERMARHHASRFAQDARVADLCCGIGGDMIGLAERCVVTAVDRDVRHLRAAEHNASVYGVRERVSFVESDVRDVALDQFSGVFIDPARRSGDRRLRAGGSDPPLEWCFEISKAIPAVAIKAGPALPLDVVPEGWEIEFVSEGRELKEALLWSPAVASVRTRATLLPGGETLVGSVGAVSLGIRLPGRYVLDPDPAITRAGLVEPLGATVGDCWKLDASIAFLSSDAPMATPFGRLLEVEASMPWSLARVREALGKLDVGRVDIRKRGSAVDVDEVQKRFRLTGSRAATLVLTMASGAPWALVCFDVD